jgi:hypothetical protein
MADTAFRYCGWGPAGLHGCDRAQPSRSNRSRPRGRPYSDGVWAMEITGCPSCGAPAEVEPWSAMASTSGPLAHVKTFCVNRHSYLMPRDMLAMPSGPDELRSAW